MMKCSNVCHKLNDVDLSIMKSTKNLKNKNAKKKKKGIQRAKDGERSRSYRGQMENHKGRLNKILEMKEWKCYLFH